MVKLWEEAIVFGGVALAQADLLPPRILISNPHQLAWLVAGVFASWLQVLQSSPFLMPWKAMSSWVRSSRLFWTIWSPPSSTISGKSPLIPLSNVEQAGWAFYLPANCFEMACSKPVFPSPCSSPPYVHCAGFMELLGWRSSAESLWSLVCSSACTSYWGTRPVSQAVILEGWYFVDWWGRGSWVRPFRLADSCWFSSCCWDPTFQRLGVSSSGLFGWGSLGEERGRGRWWNITVLQSSFL